MRELLPDTFSRQTAYRVKIYLAAILLLLVKTGLGQGFESAMGRISYRDGIEGHNPHASMISSDGKLWIYTEKQLNCYDGYRVRAFLDEDPPVVARLNNLLFEAPDGTIWAGSYMLERKARVDLCGNLTIKVVITKTACHFQATTSSISAAMAALVPPSTSAHRKEKFTGTISLASTKCLCRYPDN